MTFWWKNEHEGWIISFFLRNIPCRPSLWLGCCRLKWLNGLGSDCDSLRTAMTTASSGSRSLSLIARHSNIGASMEPLVVTGGEGPYPIALSSTSKPFRMPSLLIKKLFAESKSAVEN